MKLLWVSKVEYPRFFLVHGFNQTVTSSIVKFMIFEISFSTFLELFNAHCIDLKKCEYVQQNLFIFICIITWLFMTN
jgi:hypothetical protein